MPFWSCCSLLFLAPTSSDVSNNQLSGEIPSKIGNCGAVEELLLFGNNLAGTIPDSMKHLTKLIELNLQDNDLEGEIPGKSFLYGMRETLTTLSLQGNKLTGLPPSFLWYLAYYRNYKLAALNIGNNLLSGPVPTHHTFEDGTYVGKTFKLTDRFSELWLVGNNWDGGPCVALCGGINAGALDDAKRASVKIWANKCLEDTDSHKDLVNSTYSVDELGRCSFKSNCSKATYYVERRTIVDPDCKRCPVHTYQSNSSHTETECANQPTCGAGQSISKDDDDLRTERRSCAACATNTYQSSDEHRLTDCIDQPTCDAGQKITGTDGTVDQRRICVPCPPGFYQNKSSHRETGCKPQPSCTAGTTFEVTSTAERECTPCGDNEYQDSDDADALQLTCIAQPTCSRGQYITDDSKTSRRVCNVCPPGFYQSKAEHRDTKCIKQRTCPAGTEFTTTSSADRACSDCGENEYQDSSDANALQTICIEQTFCAAGQKMAEDTKTKRRQCSDCPAGQYQDDSEHRSTTCTEQPKCWPGTLFKGSLYAKRTCDACPSGTYQTAIDHTEPTCIPQQGCLLQQEFAGNSTTKGRCEPCKDGSVQPKNNHFDACIDPSHPTTVCNGVGELSRDGTCECNPGFAGPQCEFSNEGTCNGLGSVSYNAQANSASCSNCTDPAVAVGDRCQFSNSETCKDFGIVSGNGTCDWNRDPFDEPIVSECPPGYYYNPNPETAGNEAEEEDAIEVRADGCYPCSPGEFASDTARRVQCDVCPTLQTSEAASKSASDCFAKFQSAAADQQFCYGKGSITSDVAGTVEIKSLSRITSSEDCSSSAGSLGFNFAGEYVLPYPGCVYDATHQEARFYVDQSTYDTSVSVASAHGNNRHNDDENNDRRRRRRQEHQQHQQRQRKEEQPREQDQQPRQSGNKKRRRKWVLVPKKDTPLCEVYVCKDPENDVTPLTSDPANADKFPSCRVSDAQIQAAVQEESETNRKKFVPAMMSIAFATLGGSYGYQHWSAKKSGGSVDWYDVWIHIHVWLTFLRAIDIQSDFGFYFISLRGAFLEAYGDGNPETNPYTEPNVAAFLFAAVFFTALGLFLSPFDIWVMGRRTAGDTLSMFSILIIISISLLEDFPQMILCGIYLTTMNAAGIPIDVVAILSLLVSAASLLFSCGTVYTHVQKLREQDPTGWWRIGGAEDGGENARLRAENAALNKRVAKLTQRIHSNGASDTLVQMANPMFNVDATNTDDYVEVQGAIEAQTSGQKQPEEQFGGFTDTNNEEDACESGKQTGKECARPKAGKSKYCKKHTCKEKKCYRMKSSKVEYCNQHTGTEL